MEATRSLESERESHKSGKSSEVEQPFMERFKQQMLKAWLPIPSLSKTIILFFLMSAIFLGIGIPMLILSNTIVQVTVGYDTVCSQNAINCTLTFTIPQTMNSPISVYYQLQNYYQNHRLYASSISYKQLKGESLSLSEAQTICQPIVTNADLKVSTSLNGSPLNSSAVANPCGIVAYSIFTDTFNVLDSSGSNISMTTNDIAWPSDLEQYTYLDESTMWLNITDPRFMNWIRIAPLPSFRKLWAKINVDLQPGTYTLRVNNTYTVSQFNVNKYFILSTSNFFGARNEFLSITYLAMGGLCFMVAVGFLIKKIKKDRKVQHQQ